MDSRRFKRRLEGMYRRLGHDIQMYQHVEGCDYLVTRLWDLAQRLEQKHARLI